MTIQRGPSTLIRLMILILLISPILAITPSHSLRAGELSLEGGLVIGADFPTGSGRDDEFFEGGILAEASYEEHDWSIGARGINTFSTETSMEVKAGSYDLTGTLTRRLIQLGLFSRIFLHDPKTARKSWYFELGFLGAEIDFIHAEQVYVIPESTDYTRLFLRGNGFSLGAGYRPRNGPWFYQFNYLLRSYQTLLVEGEVKKLHQTLDTAKLDANYFVHSLVFVVGLDVFGRP